MSAVPGIQFVVACLPALLSAGLFGASTALASISDARKQALVATCGSGNAKALSRYLAVGDVIETRWTVLRVIGLSASSVLWYLALARTAPANARAVLAIAATLVAFGFPAEVFRTIFVNFAEKVAPSLIRVFRPLELVAIPIAWPLVLLNRMIMHLMPEPGSATTDIAGDEVGIIVDEGEKSGEIAHDEAQLIKNVLDFGDLTVGEIMVPRTHVDAIELTTPALSALERICEDEHSRYPVYAERIDNVIGVLHAKDLISHLDTKQFAAQLELESLVRRPALYVSDGQTATSVLQEMRSKRQHLAIVIDEFGGMRGIVTLEDLVERIVGDIRDEHDEEPPLIVPLPSGGYLIDASASVFDVNKQLDVELPEDDSYNSLGGLLISRIGRVPPVGTRLTENGLEFLVRRADDRHIAEVEVVRLATDRPIGENGLRSRPPE